MVGGQAQASPLALTEARAEGAGAEAFGRAVAGPGDVDGDGFDELLVGGPAADGGSVYLLWAGATDLADRVALSPPVVRAGAALGQAVAGADLDGDGGADLVAAAPYSDTYGRAAGSFVVWYAADVVADDLVGEELGAVVPEAYAGLGFSMACVGDMDGDGSEDLAIGAPNEDLTTPDSGAIFLYYGREGPLDLSRALTLSPSMAASYDHYGWSVARAGDVNGDGYADLITGAPGDDALGAEAGAAWLLYGGFGDADPDNSALLRAEDGSAEEWFGEAVAGLGDRDGDGLGDLAISLPYDDDVAIQAGALYLVYGGDLVAEKLTNPDGAGEDNYGKALAGPGDLDGDGLGDLLVGAPHEDPSGSASGAFYALFSDGSEERLIASDGEAEARLGWSLAGAGDLNGDGAADIVAGAPDGVVGAVYTWRGSCPDPDGDGYCPELDCDDADAGVYPGAPEVIDDGIDQDCDGYDLHVIPPQDTADTDDTGGAGETGIVGTKPLDKGMCTCGLSAGPTRWWPMLVLLVGLSRRRAR